VLIRRFLSFSCSRVGVHPLRISKGFEMAAQVAIDNVGAISEQVVFTLEDPTNLIETVMTSLGSKIVNNYQV
jgi:T-complex protein 1 subunit epsilon